MNLNTYKGEVLNFFELISTHKVEIPIIQRDYAQGRKDKKEIRRNFLNALFNCISFNQPIKLDFIYGSNIDHSFQPLDGQQRLTTLFLLHWYAGFKDSQLTLQNKKVLSNFSYETRISSRDFCLALVNNSIIWDGSKERISESIIDSNWFFLSWQNDPTIDSMLRSLDDIHLIFNNIDNLWNKLTSKPSLISFHFVELENIGLTDDLYIKMNARGKLLTPFENFKASFQKQIEDKSWELNRQFTDTFIFKLDTSWTDLFWHHFRKNNSVDDALMRFITTIAMIRQVIDRENVKAEERISLITLLQEKSSQVRPENFNYQGFEYLYKCFSVYELIFTNNLDLSIPFPLWRHTPKGSLLSDIVFSDNESSISQYNNATYTQKVLFFAQTEYLLRNIIFDRNKYLDWMRVIRNIISRGDIDKDGNRPDIIRSPQAFDGVINLVNELAEYCEDIYQNLSQIISIKSQFAKDQVEEERVKAKLIINNPQYKCEIFEAEDNELLRGKIEFIFYCIDYNKEIQFLNIELFTKVKDTFKNYFNSEDGLNNELRRAMLTIEVNGNYEFYNYWWSYWHLVGATKRRLFDKFRELEYYIYSDFKEYFKKLILLLGDNDYKQITDNFIPNECIPGWKRRLIKEKILLDEQSKSSYIAIKEDNSGCYLLKSKRPRDLEGSMMIE